MLRRCQARFVDSTAPHRKCHWCTTANECSRISYATAATATATPVVLTRFSDLSDSASRNRSTMTLARSLSLSVGAQTRARSLLFFGRPHQSYAYSRLQHPATLHPPATFCHTHTHTHCISNRIHTHIYQRTAVRIYIYMYMYVAGAVSYLRERRAVHYSGKGNGSKGRHGHAGRVRKARNTPDTYTHT